MLDWGSMVLSMVDSYAVQTPQQLEAVNCARHELFMAAITVGQR
jgi:hypothetical protein